MAAARNEDVEDLNNVVAESDDSSASDGLDSSDEEISVWIPISVAEVHDSATRVIKHWNISKLTDMQAQVLADSLNKRAAPSMSLLRSIDRGDSFFIAGTGSGKSLAAFHLIGILEYLLTLNGRFKSKHRLPRDSLPVTLVTVPLKAVATNHLKEHQALIATLRQQTEDPELSKIAEKMHVVALTIDQEQIVNKTVKQALESSTPPTLVLMSDQKFASVLDYLKSLLGKASSNATMLRWAKSIAYVAIDECHLALQWEEIMGKFFYRLSDIRAYFKSHLPRVFFLACSATAPADYRQDFIARVGLVQPCKVLIDEASLMRLNLRFYFFPFTEPLKALLTRHLAQDDQGGTIVYCQTVAVASHCATVAFEICRELGRKLPKYYTGASSELQRSAVMDEFSNAANPSRNVMATIACGAGVNAPHVDTVVIIEFPTSSLDVWQMGGRAGRKIGSIGRVFVFIRFTDSILQKANLASISLHGATVPLASHFLLSMMMLTLDCKRPIMQFCTHHSALDRFDERFATAAIKFDDRQSTPQSMSHQQHKAYAQAGSLPVLSDKHTMYRAAESNSQIVVNDASTKILLLRQAVQKSQFGNGLVLARNAQSYMVFKDAGRLSAEAQSDVWLQGIRSFQPLDNNDCCDSCEMQRQWIVFLNLTHHFARLLQLLQQNYAGPPCTWLHKAINNQDIDIKKLHAARQADCSNWPHEAVEVLQTIISSAAADTHCQMIKGIKKSAVSEVAKLMCVSRSKKDATSNRSKALDKSELIQAVREYCAKTPTLREQLQARQAQDHAAVSAAPAAASDEVLKVAGSEMLAVQTLLSSDVFTSTFALHLLSLGLALGLVQATCRGGQISYSVGSSQIAQELASRSLLNDLDSDQYLFMVSFDMAVMLLNVKEPSRFGLPDSRINSNTFAQQTSLPKPPADLTAKSKDSKSNVIVSSNASSNDQLEHLHDDLIDAPMQPNCIDASADSDEKVDGVNAGGQAQPAVAAAASAAEAAMSPAVQALHDRIALLVRDSAVAHKQMQYCFQAEHIATLMVKHLPKSADEIRQKLPPNIAFAFSAHSCLRSVINSILSDVCAYLDSMNAV